MTTPTIAFIGTGIMGKPMAINLQKAGYSIVVSDHFVAPPQELVDGGATVVHSGKEAAQQADVIITMVPNTPDVADALFGDNGIAQGLSAGKLVIDMSSIAPIETQEFAKQIKECGAEYLDAPVSGGEVGAINAALTIMVGGNEAAFERAKPLFEVMGKNITLVGDNGAGQICKVANQIDIFFWLVNMKSWLFTLFNRSGVRNDTFLCIISKRSIDLRLHFIQRLISKFCFTFFLTRPYTMYQQTCNRQPTYNNEY